MNDTMPANEGRGFLLIDINTIKLNLIKYG